MFPVIVNFGLFHLPNVVLTAHAERFAHHNLANAYGGVLVVERVQLHAKPFARLVP